MSKTKVLDLTLESDKDEDEDDNLTTPNTQQEFALVATCEVLLVGIRYYTGTAHAGEYVKLTREPSNPYDSNAVRVDNMRGEKVGHVKREQAAILAPLMDDETLKSNIEGTIPKPGNTFSMPISLEFLAVGDSLLDLQSSAITLAKRIQTAFRGQYKCRMVVNPELPFEAGSPPPQIHRKAMDWQSQAKELDAMFERQLDEQLKNLPNIEMPHQLCDHVQLFDYQKDGIRWLVHQESMNAPPPFFRESKENGKNMWLCEITLCSQSQPPKPVKGSILADEMGLGKTLQTIGLILAAPPANHIYGQATPARSLNNIPVPSEQDLKRMKVPQLKEVLRKAGISLKSKKDELVQQCVEAIQSQKITGEFFPPEVVPSQSSTKIESVICTLIVCPVSVMSTWDSQIENHVKPNVLRVKFYQGPNRAELLSELQTGSIDVLLVSYNTLAMEFSKIFDKTTENNLGEPPKKRGKQFSIFDINFHRIVLDEAHIIRSIKTKLFKGVKEVKAARKLALTGTPFVNRADDIHSLLSFLGVESLGDKDIYRRAITIPIQNGDSLGLTRLRAIMAHVALRRSKALAKIELGPKEVVLDSITFPEGPHKSLYDALFGSFRLAFEAVLQDGENVLMKKYSSIFEKLLRMRQSCCSAILVPEERREAAIATWKELQQRGSGKALSAQEGLQLLEKLNGTFASADGAEVPECAVCLTEMDEPDCVILKTCSHVFCEACASRLLSDNSSCPLCRQSFDRNDLVKKSAATQAATQEPKDEKSFSFSNDDLGASPKILALLESIKRMQPDEKGVIFSQFTKFLDLIGDALKKANHSFTRVDGSMNSTKRMEAVRSFCSDDDGSPRFILCSLHAAGTGINLTRGNHAFMMDCWWNLAVENQAMDRIHRIGQLRNVYVTRFVMKDSIEERMVDLQEAKSMQAKGAMEKLKADELKKTRLSDLKSLMLLNENEKTKIELDKPAVVELDK